MNRLKLTNMNIRKISKYAVIFLLMIVGAMMERIVMGESAQLESVTQNLSNAQLQLMTMQGQYAKLNKEVKQGNQQSTSSVQLNQLLPPSLGITDVLVQMTKLAVTNGISLNSFTFSSSNNPSANSAQVSTLSLSSLPYVDVNLTVSGTTSKIKNFIYDLEHQTQLTSVQSFSLNNGSANSGTVAINLWLYYQSNP